MGAPDTSPLRLVLADQRSDSPGSLCDPGRDSELGGLFGHDLLRRISRPMPPGAIACPRAAKTNEDVSRKSMR